MGIILCSHFLFIILYVLLEDVIIMDVNFHIRRCNDTFAVVVFDDIYATTTNYDEIEDIVDGWCDRHGVEYCDVSIIEH